MIVIDAILHSRLFPSLPKPSALVTARRRNYFEVRKVSVCSRRSVLSNVSKARNKRESDSASQPCSQRTNLLSNNFLTVRCVSGYSRKFSTSSSRNMGVFRFSDYDCIGFDLDNTLLRYNVTNMVTLEYEVLSRFMVEKRGHDPKHLAKNLGPDDFDFLQKGLILDFDRGNILRLSPEGRILRVSHGTRILTEDEMDASYPERRWEVTDSFAGDFLVTWNGPLSEKMRTLLDYFDMPASLVFAKVVDTLDEKNGGEQLQDYHIWSDILDGLIDMFDRSNFAKEDGIYFPSLRNQPEKFMHKSSPELIAWLKELKKSKMTYLITGSNADFANFTASFALGEDWRSLFDIVVCYARKPGFFTGSRPFLSLTGDHSEAEVVPGEKLKRGGMYSQGNWKELKDFFSRETGNDSPACLYVGDNLIQDIYTPKLHAGCDTVAVVEEQLAEGMLDHSHSHRDENILNSTIWGSYFHIESRNSLQASLWNHVINSYSRICVPSVEFIVANSLDTPIKSFGHEEDRKSCGYYPGKPKSIVMLK